MEATTGELEAMRQHRDNKEGPSHLAWCKDPDIRHDSQHGITQRKRRPKFFTRNWIPEKEKP